MNSLEERKIEINNLINDFQQMLRGKRGGFKKALAEAFAVADLQNRNKLLMGFPEMDSIIEAYYVGERVCDVCTQDLPLVEFHGRSTICVKCWHSPGDDD